ncbi:MAG TPA: phosphoribosylformylglycinamidine cyclo-ligase [Haliangiales bacterium]|nr:phosphoribosylformylglycinamidine cyclo-ligase [Haliangiales bacterium]
MAKGKLTYKDAGVDIDAKDGLVERIKPLARLATRPEVVADVGGFAGLIGIPGRYRQPLLVSGADGVGTKLKSAFATGRHDTVGIDLVAMSVNDVLVTGAEPLFFLDYLATGKLDLDVAEAVVRGVVEGCRRAGCALLGGETAELPGFYAPGEYDLAGFCVGVVERDDVRDGRGLAAGDALVGIASSGLHSNGHSLARKILLEVLGHGWDDRPAGLCGASVADVLLEPTRIYTPAFRALAAAGVAWKGAAHITGGGLVHNPPRFVPEGSGLALRFRLGSWPVPPVFAYLAAAGPGVDAEEMRATFNLGLGMVVAVPAGEAARAIAALGGGAWIVGEVVPRAGAETEFAS